mmetsp:Transcript_76201/g.210275  ORF Transcript_76201/g.210275 Transcript_76201/m.210275 type:complete len:203 (+) Transcript_76201:711-1319(+)
MPTTPGGPFSHGVLAEDAKRILPQQEGQKRCTSCARQQPGNHSEALPLHFSLALGRTHARWRAAERGGFWREPVQPQPAAELRLSGQQEDGPARRHDGRRDRTKAHEQGLDVAVSGQRHEEAEKRQLHCKDRVEIQAAGDVAPAASKKVEVERVVQLLEVVAEAPNEMLHGLSEHVWVHWPAPALVFRCALATDCEGRHLQL